MGTFISGENNVIDDFWYLGKGGWMLQDIKMLYFWLFTLSINIH